jgi:hypothetical protein
MSAGWQMLPLQQKYAGVKGAGPQKIEIFAKFVKGNVFQAAENFLCEQFVCQEKINVYLLR